MIDPGYRHRPATVPGYMGAVVALGRRHAVPGELLEVAILHDATCPYPTGRGPCRCTPEVKLMADHQRDEAQRN